MLSVRTGGEAFLASHLGDVHLAVAGIPQLNFATYPSQIFWLLVSLSLLYVLLSRITLPRIETVIRDRQDTISSDLDKAAEFKQRAQEAEKSYEQALAAAHERAHQIAQKTRDEMQADLDAVMAKANAEIAQQAEESRHRVSQIEASAVETVQVISKDLIEHVLDKVLVGVEVNKEVLVKSAQDNIKRKAAELGK